MRKIDEMTRKIQPINKSLLEQTQKRLDNLTKPLGSLGDLEEIAKRIVAITNKQKPILTNKIIFTLASDHGITEEKVSAYPKEVTVQMVYNFINGGAGINVLARHIGAKVVVVDIGVASELKVLNAGFRNKKINYGTKNFIKGPAMTTEEAIQSIEIGIELVEEYRKNSDIHIVGTGDMGIGNTSSASAITSVIISTPVERVTGRGTGIDDDIFQNKIKQIEKSISINKPDKNDAIDILSKIGGYEIGGIAGIILACAAYRIPVVIDGFISGAGALLASKLQPASKDYMFAGHCSQEPGHIFQLNWLRLNPILNLNMRLGEGTGACLAMSIIEASCKILNEMATFDSANVSKKDK